MSGSFVDVLTSLISFFLLLFLLYYLIGIRCQFFYCYCDLPFNIIRFFFFCLYNMLCHLTAGIFRFFGFMMCVCVHHGLDMKRVWRRLCENERFFFCCCCSRSEGFVLAGVPLLTVTT